MIDRECVLRAREPPGHFDESLAKLSARTMAPDGPAMGDGKLEALDQLSHFSMARKRRTNFGQFI